MIQVVADSTLLRYLIEIEVVDVLPVLFGQIIALPAVIHDLQHINTPVSVRTWIASPPLKVALPARRLPIKSVTLSYGVSATGKSGMLWGLVVVGVCWPLVSSFTRSATYRSSMVTVMRPVRRSSALPLKPSITALLKVPCHRRAP